MVFYPANASSRIVIASEAKQSSGCAMDDFVASLLAMTQRSPGATSEHGLDPCQA
jgi:hypothetical protein